MCALEASQEGSAAVVPEDHTQEPKHSDLPQLPDQTTHLPPSLQNKPAPPISYQNLREQNWQERRVLSVKTSSEGAKKRSLHPKSLWVNINRLRAG